MGYDIYVQDQEGRFLIGDENYFRIADTRMPGVLDAMQNLGMVVETANPPYPQLDGFQLTEADFQTHLQRDPEVTQRIDAFRAAYQAVKDAAEPEPTAIPKYKLSLSDGFLVTVPELTAALKAYAAHPAIDISEMPWGQPDWGNWISFLRRAQVHGGLRTL
ncbi:hypothetical protein [Streptomyces sp. NPDC093111]|uniref:hypothetical protein n=1 Tax=Streptomyces sp. NPDC093111 TaxID=3154978 RepID=UPI003418E829